MAKGGYRAPAHANSQLSRPSSHIIPTQSPPVHYTPVVSPLELPLTISPTLALFALLAAQQAQDATQPPATAHLRTTLVGYGVQIYHCTAQNPNEPDPKNLVFEWTLEGPEAALFDPTTQKQVGTHSAGPTWTSSDGSAITGKVLQKQPSPDPAAIPWLLLEAHPANDTTGAFSGITFVRRSNTKAGAAPATGCDAQHYDIRLRVPYEATYTFYSAN